MTGHFTLSSTLLVVLAAAPCGCGDPERVARAEPVDDAGSDDETDAAVEVDEADVLARATDFSNELIRISEMAEQEETHADAAAVVVWGSADALATFASIDPNDPTQDLAFPAGTMFVKQHLDEAGATRGMSVMYKAPPGYDPEGRDWFWARVEDDVVTDSGRVSWCSSCHAAAYNSDFVVGFGKSP